MGEEVLVKSVSATLAPVDKKLSITVASHSLALAPSGPTLTVGGKEVLVESDIEASFATYVAAYTTAIHDTPGSLKFAMLNSVDGLSTVTTKKGNPVALKGTTGTISVSLVSPAINSKPPTPVPDATPMYEIDFSFSDAAQTLVKSS
ncbi:hypothetical protein [Teredinibacter purpureus]|uniref:hypothetical protein n=1 Tax=Teredinibacter purpureus TaxID=2731756 RepID=UPI0005F7FAA2|nr:hypothetical protein [Teredinibacter purpureus]